MLSHAGVMMDYSHAILPAQRGMMALQTHLHPFHELYGHLQPNMMSTEPDGG